MDSYVALYGAVAIQKSYCEQCQRYAFVIGGELVCCDREVEQEAIQTKRESTPDGLRRLPPIWWRRKTLDEQDYRCFYCARLFHMVIARQGKGLVELKVHWDHRIPFSLTQDNRVYNYVAACVLCNLFKSRKIFITAREARHFLEERWQREKFEIIHEPTAIYARDQLLNSAGGKNIVRVPVLKKHTSHD